MNSKQFFSNIAISVQLYHRLPVTPFKKGSTLNFQKILTIYYTLQLQKCFRIKPLRIQNYPEEIEFLLFQFW